MNEREELEALRRLSQLEAKASGQQAPEPNSGFLQGVGNLAAGAVRGAGSIGATLLTPYDLVAGNTKSIGNPERRQSMDDALQSMGAHPDSWMYKGGQLAGEVAGTAGAGGGLAGVASRYLPGAVTSAPRFLQAMGALKTGGFSVGRNAAANIGTRVAAGAGSGAVGAGLINPEDAGTGALIGGALPLGMQGIKGVSDLVRYVRRPPEAGLSNKLAQSLSLTPEELTRLLQAGSVPSNKLAGYRQTVPQILQNPVSSQLQRTLKTAGTNAIGDAERVQQGIYRDAMEGIAPIGNSVQDAADRAGGAIQDFAFPAYKQEGKRVTQQFDAVDPFNESAIMLPLDEMKAAYQKYHGAGTFGEANSAGQALATARQVGTKVIPGVDALPKQAASKSQTLEQAVRAGGGIRGNSGELRDLGIRESGTTGLVNNKTGRAADLVAEEMHRRGYLSDADPGTLMDALRNSGGRKLFANDQVESNAMQRLAESAMGDAPVAETVAQSVPFSTVQNLRKSIGEAAQKARLAGSASDAASLDAMRRSIDDKLESLSSGGGEAGEMFARDMSDTYRGARALHAAKKTRFETGPQRSMFREGGDGQRLIQGAEIPGKFFSGRRSQVEDMQSFKRLAGSGSDLTPEMKSYAMTEAADTANVAGELTSKYGKWLKSRSGANRELFSAGENETMREIGAAVKRSINAENLGRVSGSDTAQKLAALNSLGLLDNKMVTVLATRIPGVGAFTGPMLTSLRETAGQSRNNALAKLLANPDDLVKALQHNTPQSNKLLEWMSKQGGASSKYLVPAMSGGED